MNTARAFKQLTVKTPAEYKQVQEKDVATYHFATPALPCSDNFKPPKPKAARNEIKTQLYVHQFKTCMAQH